MPEFLQLFVERRVLDPEDPGGLLLVPPAIRRERTMMSFSIRSMRSFRRMGCSRHRYSTKSSKTSRPSRPAFHAVPPFGDTLRRASPRFCYE